MEAPPEEREQTTQPLVRNLDQIPHPQGSALSVPGAWKGSRMLTWGRNTHLREELYLLRLGLPTNSAQQESAGRANNVHCNAAEILQGAFSVSPFYREES